jgi:hypothetical protein
MSESGPQGLAVRGSAKRASTTQALSSSPDEWQVTTKPENNSFYLRA